MSAIKVVLTAAGRAALVNADHTGTRTVLVSAVGFSSTAFTPAPDLVAMPGEVKRLNAVKGGAVAADTIHVSVSDTSADVYTVYGFGMYLSDGTLLATYSQPGVIVEKSAQAQVLLAVDIQFADIDATTITFGDTDFALNRATTEVQGVVELATNDEASAGTDVQRAVTPAALKAAIDGRFGAGAASDFVKTLLNLATVALFRAALGLKSASLKDMGAGNGLDADLLDGQQGAYYLSWSNLIGVPATFPPAAHRTDWSTIDGAPDTATRNPSWVEVTDKPATFPPSPHSHAIANVNGLQDALDAKANLIGANFTGGVTSPSFATTGAGSIYSFTDRTTGNYCALYAAGGRIQFWANGSTNPAASGVNHVSIDEASGTLYTRYVQVTGGDVVMQTATGGLGGLMISTPYPNPSSSAYMAFNRNGEYATYFGLRNDNNLCVGGWSMGASTWRIVHEGLGGTIVLNAAVVANGGFQYSDRRKKRDIKRRPVKRGLALLLARNFKQWIRIDDGVFDTGVIAQWLRKHASHYVMKTKTSGKGKDVDKKQYLAVDKPGLALEASMDNALDIDEIKKSMAALARRVHKLERTA